MSGVQGRYWQDEPANGSPTGRGRTAGPGAVDGPPPTEDADLAAAVRATTRMRTAFYVVVLLIALGGQVSGAMEALGMPWYVALPAVGALELGGMVVLANADVRRRLGEHATLSRVLSAAIAGGAVAFNWLAHDNHLEGGFYGGMSLLGYLVWLMNTENKRRDRLRAKRQLPPTPPAYEVVGHWLRHPMLTRRARSLAKAAPGLGLYGSLDAARAQVRTERRQTALAKVLRRKIRRALDGTTADIAVAVYDLDEIARRLAERADYDGLTALIAADLAPARVLAGNLPAGRRRRWRRRGAPLDAAVLASAGQLLTDALATPTPSLTGPDTRSFPATSHGATDVRSIAGGPRDDADTRSIAGTPADADDVRSAPGASSDDAEHAPVESVSIALVDRGAPTGERVAPSAGVDPDPTLVDPAPAPTQPVAGPDDPADQAPTPAVDRPTPAVTAGAEEGTPRSDPERNGTVDPGDRSESGRPRWDALTAEVSAIFSTAQQRRPARTAPERETASGRTAPERESASVRTAPEREAVSGRSVAARESSGRVGAERRSVSARIGAERAPESARVTDEREPVSERGLPVEPEDGMSAVPLLDRPLPDLVARRQPVPSLRRRSAPWRRRSRCGRPEAWRPCRPIRKARSGPGSTACWTRRCRPGTNGRTPP